MSTEHPGLLRWTLACVALIALLSFVNAAFASNSYPEINRVASWLALRPVTVQCLTPKESENDPDISWGAEAYVAGTKDVQGNWHPSSVTVFKYGYCEDLLALIKGDAKGRTVDDFALAVLILTHESGHLRGHKWSDDEAKTECWAIRHVGYVARKLGVTDPAANRLLVSFALVHHNELDPTYRLPTCVLPGGRDG